MLEDCLIESRSSVRRKNPLTLVVSVVTHGSLIAALILIPLFQEQLLPHMAMFEPLPPPTVRASAVPLAAAPQQAARAQTAPAPTALLAPLEIPREIARYVDQPIAGTEGFSVAGPGGGPIGIPGGIGVAFGDPNGNGSKPPPAPPAPLPAPPKAPEGVAAPTTPVRRGGDLMKSSLVHQVTPIYPPLAIKTRTEGAVTIEAVITRQGTIDPARVRVLKGHILLDQAAVDAILQWRYKPTTLNGETVEILTTIAINFTLAR
jgi:protein TonB